MEKWLKNMDALRMNQIKVINLKFIALFGHDDHSSPPLSLSPACLPVDATRISVGSFNAGLST